HSEMLFSQLADPRFDIDSTDGLGDWYQDHRFVPYMAGNIFVTNLLMEQGSKILHSAVFSRKIELASQAVVIDSIIDAKDQITFLSGAQVIESGLHYLRYFLAGQKAVVSNVGLSLGTP